MKGTTVKAMKFSGIEDSEVATLWPQGVTLGCAWEHQIFFGGVKGVPPKKTWIMLGYVVHLNVKDLVHVFIFNMNESQ